MCVRELRHSANELVVNLDCGGKCTIDEMQEKLKERGRRDVMLKGETSSFLISVDSLEKKRKE